MKMSYATFRRKPFWLIPLLLGVAVLFMPFYIGEASVLRTVTSIALLALLVLGLNVVFGYAGELSMGQAAVYAVGAYVGGYFAVQGLELPLTLVLAVIAAAAVGLLTGIPGIRLGSWSLAMVTFFLVLLVPDFVILLSEFTGGSAGMAGIPLPMLFGEQLDSTGYFMVVILVVMLFFVLIRNYIVSRHGTALRVMRESPILARSLGYSIPRLKLTAYVISALPAGAAGALFAYQDGYISPVSFAFSMAIAILAASIIGGSDSIYGSLVGAAIMVIGPLRFSGAAQFSLVLFGILLVVGGLFFTGGIALLFRRIIRQRFVGDDLLDDVQEYVDGAEVDIPDLKGESLVVRGLEKSFGGNHVLRGVDFTAEHGQITALIGPNGSGKTTLLNVVSGFYPSDSGSISLGSREVTGFKAHRIAKAGVSRTFQTPLIPKDLTVAEVVSSARYSRSSTSVLSAMLRLPGTWRARRDDRRQALAILALMGIVELADQPASELPLGTRRILEVARALAGRPAVVLLDEPASGLDESEVDALAEVLMRLRDHGSTIVIVEHNFEMVMSIADRVNVLHLGNMIASGRPSEVRNDPDVVESYLGKAAREELEKKNREGAK